jgi:hypothetical protein
MGVLSFILALSLAPQAVAVSPVGVPDQSGLEVSSHYWGHIRKREDPNMPLSAQRLARARRNRRSMEPPLPEPVFRESYVLVRNTGTRTVKSVTWIYVFFEDAKHERELRRFTFRTKQKLAPGEMKFLTEGVGEKAPSSFGEVRIESVEYEASK